MFKRRYLLSLVFASILFAIVVGLPAGIYAGNMEVKLPSSDGSDAFEVQDSTGKSLMDVWSNGKVGIGTTSKLYPLSVSGNLSRSISVANSSTANDVVGVYGEISSESPGSYSAAVRGVNKGTGGLGIGVSGSQEGSR